MAIVMSRPGLCWGVFLPKCLDDYSAMEDKWEAETSRSDTRWVAELFGEIVGMGFEGGKVAGEGEG